ncbi:hypothetical protein [Mycobacterium sp. ACS4331]|uniref:hypothetical protein n=1 Tax=Mycobacterium sp. ACS4331 TaxID=1834121 RepID=UPI0007FE3FB9|nr:hypothetical protein [Mycobacterium sp. ACS4331]OBF27883.1 hypothetical protein A5727_02015 [Mycobacterium sp. ACS4331]
MKAFGKAPAGRLAALGVVAAALSCLLVLRPALQALTYGELTPAVAGYLAVPLVVLLVTGILRYGVVVSTVVAVAITVVVSVSVAVLFAVTLGLSLSGSPRSPVFMTLVWVCPPLTVLVLGAAALRFIRPRADSEH